MPGKEIVEAEKCWPASAIETRKVDQLKPYARNSRTHSTTQIKQIAKSMRQWGWTIPVLVDENDMILAGHARVKAAKRNRYTEVPVMVARGWTDEQKRAYVIADNRLTENGTWDREILSAEIGDIAVNFDVDLLGFNDSQLSALLGEEDSEEEVEMQSRFDILITCENEEQQAALLEKFENEGLEVKALIA